MQIRKFVQGVNNCDDIAMNFIVGYFYPEFKGVPLEGNVEFKEYLKDRQFRKKTFQKERN